ncbi:ribonuclease P protein component [Uliginosibacterium sp. H1]|uniref:ribonuclease P protein component n=1 Tax=Uliginosibacterium sp. H1 TaxID=3114757 RepID=UPI002E17057B|nr:ribonuclease P protein component [Uliginosibacterium sp. H1]
MTRLPPKLSYRFRPLHRLRKTDEYSSVFAFRRALRGRFFMLHYRPAGLSSARLGVVVAKKLARRAVLRNLIKRLAREHFRHVRDTLPAYDLILRLSQPAAKVPRAALRLDFAELLRKLPVSDGRSSQ